MQDITLGEAATAAMGDGTQAREPFDAYLIVGIEQASRALQTMNASASSDASLSWVAGSNFKTTVLAAVQRAAANAIIACTR